MAILKSDDIQEAYTKLSTQKQIHEENREYVNGTNPTILRKQRKKDPDNRLPIPLAKSAVIDMTGYAGANIEITYKNILVEDDEKLKEYQDIMREFQDYNDDDLVRTELYKDSISYRETYLVMWTSDELKLPNGMMTPEYKVAGTDKVVMIMSNDLKPKREAACYFSKEGNITSCKVFYPLFAEHWESSGGGKWERKTEYDLKYPYTTVPVIPFKMSRDGGPLFQAEKPLIDKHDAVISKSQNEMDRYNALVTLFPFPITPDFIQKFEEMKGIEDLGQYDSDKWPRYLEKNLQGVTEYTNLHIDRLERLFHKCIKVVDFNQITAQGGDESGVARAFKLIGMEFLAADIEKVFIKGFYERAELLNDIIKASTLGLDLDPYTIEVNAKRNLPIDEAAKVTIAEALKRLGVRDETLLKIIPNTIIKEPEKEAKAMAKKRAEDAARFANDINGGNDEE